MPGVVMMENGTSNVQSENNNRDNAPLTNGARNPHNGLVNHGGDHGTIGLHGPNAMTNGNSDAQSEALGASRMNDLPPQIEHVTQGFIPLNLLLSRLAQQSHNQLGDEILALAKMPLPPSVMNGNVANSDGSTEDNSQENLNKKVRLLNFIQERHSEWVKALVITNWSRKAEPVSKLIDLMSHITKTRTLYHQALDYMINIKRDLTYARVPNPDLHTALHVLSTGQAPWMPDLNYIQPPEITPEEQLEWLKNLNTLLSIRLNLDEYDNLPGPFRDFKIGSGRATFKVPGEFEVDLTIADEDPEKQFWFIDFRFAFNPAPAELSDNLRDFLERKVNEALQKDGLLGCYKFLHEFVLTQKITEYVRQAINLIRGRWTDMLKVERLKRSMAIQYWVDRKPLDGPKSYIIMGVSSGKKPGSAPSQEVTSRLSLRWFRDGTEVKDVVFPLDAETISTESLLYKVIGKHIEHTLTSFHEVLKSHGRFARGESALGLDIVGHDPNNYTLAMQLSHECHLSIKIAPITGALLPNPQSKGNIDLQHQLNKDTKRPITEQVALLERFRCHFVEDELNRHGKSRGWSICNPQPVRYEEAKRFLGTRGSHHIIWLRRRGLPDNWYIMLGQSLTGDQWWLTEVVERSGNTRITTCARLPLSSSTPRHSDKFFEELTFFSSALMSQMGILEAMHKEKIRYAAQDRINPMLPPNMKLPSIHVRLSDILSRHYPHDTSKKVSAWALDFVELNLSNVQSLVSVSPGPAAAAGGVRGNDEQPEALVPEQQRFKFVVDARVKVVNPARFGPLKGNVGDDVAFNERLGVFAFTLKTEIGTSILDTLAHRLQALSRLAGSIDAIRRCRRDVQCEEVTFNNVKLSYTDQTRGPGEDVQNVQRQTASLKLQSDNMELMFSPDNPHVRVTEKFNELINSEGFQGVPWYLSITLPVQRALDAVIHAWEPLTMHDQGRVRINIVSLSWYTVQFILGPINNSGRCLTIQIRLQTRDDKSVWHIYREEFGIHKEPDDECQKVLENIWKSNNRLWRCLGNGIAADDGKGAEALVKTIDEAIRPLSIQSPALPRPAQPKVAPPKNTNQNKNAVANRSRPQQSGSGPGSGSGPVVISLDD